MFLFQAKRPWNTSPISGWKLPQGVWNLCWCDSVGLPTNSDMMWYRTNKQWLRACCIHIHFAQAPTQNKQQVKHWTEVALFRISFYQYTPVSPAHDFHNWDWGSSQMISYTNGGRTGFTSAHSVAWNSDLRCEIMCESSGNRESLGHTGHSCRPPSVLGLFSGQILPFPCKQRCVLHDMASLRHPRRSHSLRQARLYKQYASIQNTVVTSSSYLNKYQQWYIICL